MTSTDVDTGIVPGSLPARILDHMRVAGGEFEAGELAEALQADLGEVRNAAGMLRKHARVLVRLEEGHPIYKLPEGSKMRIHGSAWRPPGGKAPKEEPEPDIEPEPATAANTTKPEKLMPSTSKKIGRPSIAAPSQDAVLAYLKAHPGGHIRDAVCVGTGLSASATRHSLQLLKIAGLVKSTGNTSSTIWHLADEPIDVKAHAAVRSTSQRAIAKATAPAKPAVDTVHAPKAPVVRPNLANYGSMAKPPTRRAFAYAIDAHGTVAINDMRLPPDEIARLIDFLERTQHVWKGAQA